MSSVSVMRFLEQCWGGSSEGGRRLGLGLVCVCVFCLVGCSDAPKPVKGMLSISSASAKKSQVRRGKSTVANAVNAARVVKRAEPKPGVQREKRVLVGSVQSNRKVVISPEVGGVIRKIYVKKGDYVKKSSRLLWIDCRDYKMMYEQSVGQISIAKAGLQLAQIQFESTRRQYRRFRLLHRRRSISSDQFDKAKTGKKLASIQLILAQKRLVLSQVGLRMAKKRKAGCMSTAPFAGVVSNRMLDEGSLVQTMPPSMVLMIEEVDPIIIEVPVGEMYIRHLKHAISVQVIIPSLGEKVLYTLSKSVLSKSLMPSFNALNRSATLRIALPNKDRKLKPGMSAEIHIVQESRPSSAGSVR